MLQSSSRTDPEHFTHVMFIFDVKRNYVWSQKHEHLPRRSCALKLDLFWFLEFPDSKMSVGTSFAKKILGICCWLFIVPLRNFILRTSQKIVIISQCSKRFLHWLLGNLEKAIFRDSFDCNTYWKQVFNIADDAYEAESVLGL